MDELTYGRSAQGRKKLVADLTNDLNVAKSVFTGNQLSNVKTVIKRYWSGGDADKFYSELKKRAEEAGKACSKYAKFIQTNLETDASNFDKLQASNAGLIAGSEESN